MKKVNLFLLILVLLTNIESKDLKRINLDEHEKVFTHIYNAATWGKNNQGEGFSGGGSLLKNTKEYMAYVEKFIKNHNIESVVDLGCGDWEFSKYMDWSEIDYTGYDIVASIIEKNKKLFSAPNIKFIHGNCLSMNLPKADLLLCKHVLQHLRNIDIIHLLNQCKKFRYCLITNEVNPSSLSSKNADISIGKTHTIDLSKPPFNVIGEKVLNYKVGCEFHQVFLIDNTTR